MTALLLNSYPRHNESSIRPKREEGTDTMNDKKSTSSVGASVSGTSVGRSLVSVVSVVSGTVGLTFVVSEVEEASIEVCASFGEEGAATFTD